MIPAYEAPRAQKASASEWILGLRSKKASAFRYICVLINLPPGYQKAALVLLPGQGLEVEGNLNTRLGPESVPPGSEAQRQGYFLIPSSRCQRGRHQVIVYGRLLFKLCSNFPSLTAFALIFNLNCLDVTNTSLYLLLLGIEGK